MKVLKWYFVAQVAWTLGVLFNSHLNWWVREQSTVIQMMLLER